MASRCDAAAPPAGGADADSGLERCANAGGCSAVVSRTGGGLCTGCRNAVYCSAVCQRAHWPTHRAACRVLREAGELQRRAAPTLGHVGALPPVAATLVAAEAGDAGAMYNVGALFNAGAGVAQSYASAFAWFSRCAAHAHPPANVWAALGQCYEFGDGVARDDVEAVRLYRVGVARGDSRAQFRLARCLETGVGVGEPNHAEACALYGAAAARGYPPAILNLGVCFAKGRGVPRDAPRAAALYDRARAHPRSPPDVAAQAAFNLGSLLLDGAEGVPRDALRGVEHLRRAAAAGHEPARRVLADRRAEGGGAGVGGLA